MLAQGPEPPGTPTHPVPVLLAAFRRILVQDCSASLGGRAPWNPHAPGAGFLVTDQFRVAGRHRVEAFLAAPRDVDGGTGGTQQARRGQPDAGGSADDKCGTASHDVLL